MANVYGKKKTTRNILIGVITALVIAAAIFLAVALQKDGAGMNCFQRSATAVSADGQRASVAEYRVMYDSVSMNYTDTTLDDDQIRSLQEYCANEVIKQKIYEKEAKALGIKLADEQIAACRKSADDHIASVEQYYANNLIQNGSYSKATLDKQLNSYYQSLGMGKDAYRTFLIQNAASEYYREAILQYYQENGSGIDENTLVDYYREKAEATMTTEQEDGTQKSTYSDGDFWNYISNYVLMRQFGYTSDPLLYVPEGFIYIDLIKLEMSNAAEIAEIVEEVKAGKRSFDDLKESDQNKDPYKGIVNGPYPIAENDHKALFTEEEIFLKAALLSVGEIDTYVGTPVENDDGTQTVTAYLFRRAEGNLCYDGDHGVVKLDAIDGVRDTFVEQYWLEQWLSDLKYEDVIYTYQGVLK